MVQWLGLHTFMPSVQVPSLELCVTKITQAVWCGNEQISLNLQSELKCGGRVIRKSMMMEGDLQAKLEERSY